VLLIDTYDTLAAARRIVSAGLRPAAVRVDSGDLAGLSGAVRGIFDGGGLRQTKIFVSGDLDEHRIDTLIAAGAPIDGFGVGTAVTTSADAPSLSGVYKLVEVVRNGTTVPVAKLTPGKRTLPGAKQVWRVSEAGKARRDVMGMSDESGPPQGTPLLRRVMRDGRLTDPSSPLDAIRDRCRYEVAALPAGVRRLLDAERFPVELSAALGRLSRRVSGPDDHPV
jgi:nicotinate phosphoribosyltransferase